MGGFPNELFDRGREILGRYGYRPRASELDFAGAWARLAGDFPMPVPDWSRLTAEQRCAAEAYLQLRLEADRRLEECEAVHARLLQAGIDGDLVETYAVAREAYEDTVEAFGEARTRLEQSLRGH